MEFDRQLADTAPWERGTPERPFVLCNMVTSLDGHVTVDGGSTGLGGEGDKAMFHGLRGVVDAVLAGTGTVAAETYGRLVRRPERRAAREALGLAPDPVMLLISRSGNIPWHAPLFGAPEQRVGIVTARAKVTVPDAVTAQVEVLELDDPSPAAALSALGRAFDLRAVLCEGGPTLNSALLAADLIDELFVTLAPTLVGGAPDARRLVAPLEQARDLRLEWALRAGDELLLRYAVAR